MRLALAAAILSVLTLAIQPFEAAAGAASPSPTALEQPKAKELPSAVSLSEAGLQTFWRTKVKLAFHERISTVWIVEDAVYCLTNQNRLVALDAKTGLERWQFDIPVKQEPVFRPVHPPKAVQVRVRVGTERKELPFTGVLLNTASRLFLLDRATGKPLVDTTLTVPANAGAATDGQFVFIGSIKGVYQSVTLEGGVRIWSRKTDGMISAPLLWYRDYVYVASQDHKFYCTKSAVSGDQEWSQKLDGSVTAAFEVDDEGAYVPCEDGKVYAFHPLTGQRKWQPFATKGYCRTPVQVGRRMVFQYAEGDRFYAIKIGNGVEMWSDPDLRVIVGATQNDVYVLDKDRNCRIIDETRGTVKAVVELNRLSVFASNTKTPSIYGASETGWVLCINSVSEGYLKAKDLQPPAPDASAPAPALKKDIVGGR